MMRLGFKSLSAIIMVTAVSACAPAPVPIPPPPPVVILPPPPPAMPMPPGSAALNTVIPPIGFDGVRVTPNRGLSPEEYIWHFRSALNVAALACQGVTWGEIAQNYNKFLILYKTRLTKTTKAVDAEYKKRFPGQNGLRVRDTKMTDLYNYFSLASVRQQYCDVSLIKSREVLLLTADTLPAYSVTALGEIDLVYINFFNAFVQYERDLADWNLKYAPQPVATIVAPAQMPITTAPVPITTTPVPATNIPIVTPGT